MTNKQTERRAQIERAAFEVLEEVGYKKASMLQIAKKAKASNETLYSWYGNKQALFSSLIAANAQIVEDTLRTSISKDSDPEVSLFNLGQLLLQFTTTEKAITINRAAVADVKETGLLAGAIEESGRQIMMRLIEALMSKLETSGDFSFDEGPAAAAREFTGLLIGELQIQQALGSLPSLDADAIEQRARRTCTLFGRLYRRQQ
ncbi:MAG: TetR/AcrR family transcriptional regulator [Devosiaceae bacterium]